MVQKRTSENETGHHESSHVNGIAKETQFTRTTEVVMHARPEIQGYLLIAAGAALMLFAFGLFPMIKWLVVAAAAALVLWGVVRANVVGHTAQLIDRYRSRK